MAREWGGGEGQMEKEGMPTGNNSILDLASCVYRTLLENSQELYFWKVRKIGLHL